MWPARSEAFPHTICKLTGSRQTNWRELCQSDGLDISISDLWLNRAKKTPLEGAGPICARLSTGARAAGQKNPGGPRRSNGKAHLYLGRGFDRVTLLQHFGMTRPDP